MLHISDAEYLGEYRLRVVFNDGREGVADLRPMVFDEPRTVFEPLKDLSGFRQFFIEHGAGMLAGRSGCRTRVHLLPGLSR